MKSSHAEMHTPPTPPGPDVVAVRARSVHAARTSTRLLSLHLLLVGLWALVMGGCGPYRLAGVVVESATPAVLVVDASDERLKLPGVADARVELTLDPGSIEPRHEGVAVTDQTGRFRMDVTARGAGFLEYEAQIVVQKSGYRTSWQRMPLPGQGRVLLVMMTPGRDDYRPPTNLIEDTLRYRDVFDR